jgi:ABC-type sugar transport system substrate-binding protein
MAGTKPRLVVSLLDEAQEFQRFQADDARRVAAEAGVDAQVTFAENNPILQIQQIYKALQGADGARPDAVVVETVTGEGLERVARAAAKAGIGWVLVNRKVPYLETLRSSHPQLAIGSVSADQLEIGRLQGRQIRALAPSLEGFILYVQGPPDTSAAQQRLAGATEALQNTRLELKVIDGQWTDVSGEVAVRRWLRLKTHDAQRPFVIGCQNDHMAMGARRALAATDAAVDLARIPLTGVDGLAEGGRRLVDLGQLAATVIVPSNTGPAIRLLADTLLRGKPFPAETLLPPVSYPDMAALASPSAAWRRSASSM